MDIPTKLRRMAETIPKPTLPLPRRRRNVRRLDADLYESDDGFLALFDAPGANQSDVQLRFVEGAVLVRIDRFRDPHAEFDMRYAGRPMSADGRVELPGDASVVPEEAEATLTNDGTLRVWVPKGGAADTSVEDGNVVTTSP